MQHGRMERLNRKRGPEVWQFRWSVTGPEGKRLYHKKIVGTVERYPDENAAGRSVVGLVSEITPARSTNSGANKWTMKLRHQFFSWIRDCRPSRNSLGCRHMGVSSALIWAIGSTSELLRGFPGTGTTPLRCSWASSLRRSETAQEKISRASQHFLSHRGIG
jgi:hypothetical protein